MAASPQFDATPNINVYKFSGTPIGTRVGDGSSASLWIAGANGGRLYAILVKASADQAIVVRLSILCAAGGAVFLATVTPATLATSSTADTTFVNVLTSAFVPGLPEVNGTPYLPMAAGDQIAIELLTPDPGALESLPVESVSFIAVGGDY